MWLAISLAGILFFFFLPNRGALEWSIRLTGLLLLIHILLGDYHISYLSGKFAALFWIAAVLLLLSILFSRGPTDTHRMYRVVKMLIIVSSLHCLSQETFDRRVILLIGGIVASLIILQFVTRSFIGMPYGTYSNRHHLANLAMLTLPLLFYYCFMLPRPHNFLFVPLMFLDTDLLLRTSSRPAILALVASTAFVVLFLVQGRRKWFTLGGLAVVCILFSVTNYAGVTARIDNLFINLSTEERVQFWTDTWNMLRHNSPGAWIIGNGIGSFPESFRIYSIPEYNYFTFPHNHLLQLLYDNGLVGLLIVLSGQLSLLFLLMRLSLRCVDPKRTLFIKCVIVLYLSWLIFSNLVFGFYSRFTLYPLGFIIGISFWLSDLLPRLARKGVAPRQEGPNFSSNCFHQKSSSHQTKRGAD
jgi:O-antigen ligase